jgi:sugar lactone lactonase YvrE
VRVAGGAIEPYADLRDFGGDFANDMVVDRHGRAYVGVRSAKLRAGGPIPAMGDATDVVVAVDASGNARVAADGLVAPNGTVITPDGRTIVVAETYAHRLTAYDVDDDGALSQRRVYAALPRVYPDGICLDETGAIWVGSPYTDEFVRVREGGEITERLSVPGGVACALGGPSRRTLFLLAVDPTALPKPGASVEGTPVLHGNATLDGGRIFTRTVTNGGAGWP